MSDAQEFTREELEKLQSSLYGKVEARVGGKRGFTVRFDDLAAYALTLLDEKERAERERDEAEEAIRSLLGVLPDSRHDDDESWSWCWNELRDEAQDAVKAARQHPAVHRALERNGEG